MKPSTSAQPAKRSLFSCDLSALDEEQKQRRAQLAEWLQVGISEVLHLSNGYAFRLDPACTISQHIEELVTLEQRCCPFLKFNHTDATSSTPRLEITGPAGVKAFIAAQLGIR